MDALGTPITAHGDQSGRNRYRNIRYHFVIVTTSLLYVNTNKITISNCNVE